MKRLVVILAVLVSVVFGGAAFAADSTLVQDAVELTQAQIESILSQYYIEGGKVTDYGAMEGTSTASSLATAKGASTSAMYQAATDIMKTMVRKFYLTEAERYEIVTYAFSFDILPDDLETAGANVTVTVPAMTAFWNYDKEVFTPVYNLGNLTYDGDVSTDPDAAYTVKFGASIADTSAYALQYTDSDDFELTTVTRESWFDGGSSGCSALTLGALALLVAPLAVVAKRRG